MATAVARGLSTGRLLEPGSNNLIVFLAALAVALVGWASRYEPLAGLLDRALTTSADRTPAFLSTTAGRPAFQITLAVWLGIMQGFTESIYRLYHDPKPPWRHAFWLAPLAYAAIFGLAALGCALMPRPSTGRARFQLELWGLLTMGAFGLILIALPHVYGTAAFLLAAGLATQLARLSVAHAYVIGLVVRQSRWVVALALAAVATCAVGMDAVDARRVVAGRVEPPAGAPNVLLLVLDTVRARSMSVYGYERRTTPVLDDWSQRGVVFESAMSTAPWTLTSHAGMFTGLWGHELNTDRSGILDDRFPTLAEVLRAQGYATAGFVGNLVFTTRETGLARGFEHYEDFTLGAGEAISSTSLGSALVTNDWIRNAVGYHEVANRKRAGEINADFLDWLDGEDKDRPFFAFLNYFDAHEPYLPPARFANAFGTEPGGDRGPYAHHRNHAGHADWWKLSPDQVAHEQAQYDAAIGSLDHEIGRLFDALRARGLMDNTVVIITSDHGEHFGEHRIFTHGNNLYLPQLHVPLLIAGPGVQSSRRVAESVSLRNLPNTVLDLAGVTSPVRFPGASLVRFWRADGQPHRPEDAMLLSLFPSPGSELHPTPAAKGPMRSIIEGPYHYILSGDGGEELFNYRADPEELHNLLPTADDTSALARFRRMLETEEP